nr:MAG TPA: Terminase small subunit [Caudoviricetes sp.]
MDEPKLKPQLKLLATYYRGECAGNAEKSAVKAGYSPKYARGNAYKLVARKDVQEYMAYLDYLQNTNPANPALHIASVNEIQAFWTNVMKSPEWEMKDRLRAAESLAKSRGAFNNDW